MRQALERQGWTAGRHTLAAVLPRSISDREIREHVGKPKKARSAQRRRERAARRVIVSARHPGALWSMNTTQVERTGRGDLCAEVVRDIASAGIPAVALGWDGSARAKVEALDAAAREAGGYPLVLFTDNGSAYISEYFQNALVARKILHVRSLPRIPQHNPWVERAHRELKELAPYELCDPLACLFEQRSQQYEAARRRLNTLRVRTSRGGLTAEQLDKTADRATLETLRSELYAAGCEAAARVVLSDGSRFALRKAQREALLATLETFALITRTRGDA
ncbi:MAG: transposase [Planctomycetes bacterium]|nr:transposase [Planctomycetota bacterium]